MNKIAKIISNVFSPLLIPTYGVWIALEATFLSLASMQVRVGVTLAVFILTCLFPAIAIGALWKLGRLSDPGLNNRTERTTPYLITIASYLACAIYLWKVNAPLWLVMFMGGATLAAVVATVVNRWWKISAHMTAMGGLLALTVRLSAGDIALYNMIWWIAAVVVLCGAVGTSRLILERHTPLQVFAGFVNGFVCVLLLSLV